MSDEETTPKQPDPEVIERAKLQGWQPLEDFRGDPDRWIPADEYVRKADEMMPILKATNRNLESDLRTTKQELSQLKKTMEKVVQVHDNISKKEYDRALATIRKQQAEAISEGDSNKWAQLEQQKDALQQPSSIAGTTDADPTSGQPQQAPPEVEAWFGSNQWYWNDSELGMYADAMIPVIEGKYPNINRQGVEFLDKVKEEVRARYPEKFGNPARTRPAAVDAGTNRGGEPEASKGKKNFNDLPQEAKNACNKLVEQGMITKEKYVEEYFAFDEE